MTWYGPSGAPCTMAEKHAMEDTERERERDPIAFELKQKRERLAEVRRLLGQLHTEAETLESSIAKMAGGRSQPLEVHEQLHLAAIKPKGRPNER